MASGKQHTASDTKTSGTSSRFGSEPEQAERLVGVIFSLKPEKGYGFIRCTTADKKTEDIFFHRSGLDGDLLIGDLREGERVEFEPQDTAKGRRAEHITRA